MEKPYHHYSTNPAGQDYMCIYIIVTFPLISLHTQHVPQMVDVDFRDVVLIGGTHNVQFYLVVTATTDSYEATMCVPLEIHGLSEYKATRYNNYVHVIRLLHTLIQILHSFPLRICQV